MSAPVSTPAAALSPRDAAILEAIRAAAEAGEPCPRNRELAVVGECGSTTAALDAVKRLEKLGLISVRRFQRSRQVRVASTGQATALPSNRTPNWREGHAGIRMWKPVGRGKDLRPRRDLLSEDESRAVIEEVNAWCRRTGTNYNKLVIAARVNESTRHCVRVKRRCLTVQTALRLRTAMRANPRGITKGEHKARVRAVTERRLEQQRAQKRKSFPSAGVVVDRTPCPKCGVRRDVGCAHWPKF